MVSVSPYFSYFQLRFRIPTDGVMQSRYFVAGADFCLIA